MSQISTVGGNIFEPPNQYLTGIYLDAPIGVLNRTRNKILLVDQIYYSMILIRGFKYISPSHCTTKSDSCYREARAKK